MAGPDPKDTTCADVPVPDYEAALKEALPLIRETPGFVRLDIRPCLEKPGRYLLLVEWRELEDHTVGFRQSDLFGEWRAIVGPFFAAPPVVEHFNLVAKSA